MEIVFGFGVLVLFLTITGCAHYHSMAALKVEREVDMAEIAMKTQAVQALKEKVELRISTEDIKELFK